ncbi:MAG TPA: hypothetical protein VH589_01790 [Trebonia sp.]
MKGGTRAAMAIGVGYMLGRHKRFRTATMMAAATAVGGSTVGGMALKRGMKMLSNADALNKVAPQLGGIADTVKGDLFTAGKAAAAAAVSNRLDTLTDSIHDRAERVRNPEALVEEGAGKAGSAGRKAGGADKRAAAGAGGAARRAGRGVTGARDEEEAPEADEYDEADEADEYDEAEDYDEADDREPDEEADEAPARRAAPRRRSPVTRTRARR